MNRNIQCALLSSFLWSDDMGIDKKDAFRVDVSVFDNDFKQIAEKINDTTETNERFYSLLNLQIENAAPSQHFEIATQTPLPFSLAKKYHEQLVKDRNNKIIIGVTL